MNNKILSILKKIYHHENGFYNSELDRHEYKIPNSVSNEDLSILIEKGFKPNNFETFEHKDALKRLLSLKEHPKLTLDFAKAMFLKGITGEFPRGRQTLMSFLYVKNLYHHEYKGNKHCEISGLPIKQTMEKTNVLYTFYLGNSWNEMPLDYLIDLEEILNYKKPKITRADKDKLIELLDLISLAAPNETPGKLEKRIAKSKILPKTDKYKRYGILLTLSECGILPNGLIMPKYDKFTTTKEIWKASERLTTSHRSDIVLPFGGWKGKNGINYERYKEIFE